MGKPGRRRKATHNIVKLFYYDKPLMMEWVRDVMGPDNFDFKIMVMIEKWINAMDKPKYLKIKKLVDEALKHYEKKEVATPDITDGKKDQIKNPGLVTDEEGAVIKRFLDRKWKLAEESDYWVDYLYSIGWIYFNAFIISGDSPIQKVFESLETIKEKDPKIFQNYLATCIDARNNELEKLAQSNNVIAFPKAIAT